MLAAAAMAGVYFIVLPVVWLGVLGPEPLGHDLAMVLGPTFAPLFGSFGKAAAIWFVMFCSMARCSLLPAPPARCRNSATTGSFPVSCRGASRQRIARGRRRR